MRAEWSTEDLVGSWTLVDEDWRLVGNKSGPTRLGFALLLKFFEMEACFPSSAAELPQAAVSYVAQQASVEPEALAEYDWAGRAIKRHRVQIRNAFGFREFSRGDEDKLADWLATEVCPVELREEQLLEPGPALPSAVGRQQLDRRASVDAERFREAIEGEGRAASQVVGDPAHPRQRAQLHRDAEPVLVAVEPAKPRPVAVGQREERDRILVDSLIRPRAQPSEFWIRQVTNRHLASEQHHVRAVTARTLSMPPRQRQGPGRVSRLRIPDRTPPSRQENGTKARTADERKSVTKEQTGSVSQHGRLGRRRVSTPE
jgi:hypothetical protein